MFSSNTDSLGYQSFKGVSRALVSGLHLGDTIKGLSLVLGPLFNPDVRACVLGLRAYYFKPHQLYYIFVLFFIHIHISFSSFFSYLFF